MNINSSLLEQLAEQLGELLQARQLKLVTVESCTGGMVAQAITSVAGCSAWFEQGFIPYNYRYCWAWGCSFK
jgi:nicotinamide-nucleotide amidase